MKKLSSVLLVVILLCLYLIFSPFGSNPDQQTEKIEEKAVIKKVPPSPSGSLPVDGWSPVEIVGATLEVFFFFLKKCIAGNGAVRCSSPNPRQVQMWGR